MRGAGPGVLRSSAGHAVARFVPTRSVFRFIVLAPLVAGSAIAAAAPQVLGLSGFSGPAASVALFAIGFWLAEPIPAYLSALCVFPLAVLLKAAPEDVIFSGFRSSAFWLVFSGLIIGVAVGEAGLARAVVGRLRAFLGGRYAVAVAGVTLLSVALAFVMPATLSRVVLLVPIVVTLAESLGYRKGSRGCTGLIVATLLASYLPSMAILTGNVPNMVLLGVAETQLGLPLRYGAFLMLHFPVLGVVKAVLIVLLVARLYSSEPAVPQPPSEAPCDRLSGDRLSGDRLSGHLLLVLAVTLGLWATDVLHGIAAAWIGLGTAIYCIATGLVPQDTVARRLNATPLFYLAGVLAVGNIIASSGLGGDLTRAVSGLLPLERGADFQNFLGLTALAAGLGLVVTEPGIPAVLGPMVPHFAALTGLTPTAVLMTQVVAFSLVVLPYQVPPMIVGLALADLPASTGTGTMLFLAALTAVLILPLTFLWWVGLGLIA